LQRDAALVVDTRSRITSLLTLRRWQTGKNLEFFLEPRSGGVNVASHASLPPQNHRIVWCQWGTDVTRRPRRCTLRIPAESPQNLTIATVSGGALQSMM